MALRTPTFLSILLFTATAGAGHAAELGEAQVRSYLGQALVADVELTLLDDPNSPVRVRLANPDVYRGANIAMPPVLSSLNMTVMRQGGRQFLHLTSLKPVESRHLHVYLELLDGGQRSVRLVTLWLTPDPNPAPAPAPVREAVSEAPQAQAQRKAAPRPLPVAQAAPARKPVPPPQPAPNMHANPHADAPSCAPQPSAAHLDACVALGEKNAALRHDLVRLEEKVKTLQGAAGAAPVPAAQEAPQEAPQDAPKGAPRIQRKPKNAEPPAEEIPWLTIGAAIAAVSALAGLVLALLGRRKRAGAGKIPAAHKPAGMPKAAKAPAEGEPKPHFMAAVKARLMPHRGQAAPAAGAAVAGNEPVPTE